MMFTLILLFISNYWCAPFLWQYNSGLRSLSFKKIFILFSWFWILWGLYMFSCGSECALIEILSIRFCAISCALSVKRRSSLFAICSSFQKKKKEKKEEIKQSNLSQTWQGSLLESIWSKRKKRKVSLSFTHKTTLQTPLRSLQKHLLSIKTIYFTM